jgi:hypothetical protein
MTILEALDKLAQDRKVLERAISQIHTAQAFHAVGETDTAIAIGCNAWFEVKRHYREQWGA